MALAWAWLRVPRHDSKHIAPGKHHGQLLLSPPSTSPQTSILSISRCCHHARHTISTSRSNYHRLPPHTAAPQPSIISISCGNYHPRHQPSRGSHNLDLASSKPGVMRNCLRAPDILRTGRKMLPLKSVITTRDEINHSTAVTTQSSRNGAS